MTGTSDDNTAGLLGYGQTASDVRATLEPPSEIHNSFCAVFSSREGWKKSARREEGHMKSIPNLSLHQCFCQAAARPVNHLLLSTRTKSQPTRESPCLLTFGENPALARLVTFRRLPCPEVIFAHVTSSQVSPRQIELASMCLRSAESGGMPIPAEPGGNITHPACLTLSRRQQRDNLGKRTD
ncbi:unnamed protein product [Pleuronectes platessa]|uniref:Uncharacterized protein n=1 Tax=Pleuronectes platessa TaxID=8262 RepID=A0A9N7VSC8_PLEPL|nr:unnamed protein product [Pleuronectes platessa]